MPNNTLPWYKNHILLLIITIPLLSVVGSFFTLYLALSSQKSSVIDSYYKQGVTPAMHHYAAQTLTLRLEGGLLHVSGLQDTPALEFVFEHPTQAQFDQQYILQAVQPGLYTLPPQALSNLYSHKWYFKVSPHNADAAHLWQQRGHYDPKTMNPGSPIPFSAR